MPRIFRTRTFTRWMKKSGLSDADLAHAVEEMAQGLIDADLGGHVVKKRVATAGQGKRGGARTLVATKRGSHWFFLFGFNKNERANVARDELKLLQELASDLLALDAQQLVLALNAGEILEVKDGQD